MNKFTKGFIIAAFIFIFIGFIMVVSAFAVGGVEGITDIVRNGDLSYYGYNDFDFWFDDDYDYILPSGEEVSIDNLAAAENIKKLELEMGDRMLIIQNTDDSNFSIECKDANWLRCYVEDDELIIVDKKRNRWYGSRSLEKRKIYLNIPKDAQLSEISIDMGAGKIIADWLAADEISVGIGAGQMELVGVNANDASFSVGAGEIIIESGIIKDADLSVATGTINFEGTIQGDLDADCSVGQISMLLSGKETDHNYEVDSSMGSINIGGNSMSGFAEKRMMNNNVGSNFELSCSMGTIDIEFEE